MVFCQLWSCWVTIGFGALTLIRKHTLQLVVWRWHSACPHLLVNHTHPNTKNILHVCLWVVQPPVGLVISGNDWCWCTDTDKEAQFWLSFADGIKNLAYPHILCWTSHVMLTMYSPYILALALSNCGQIIFLLQLSYLFVLSLYVIC